MHPSAIPAIGLGTWDLRGAVCARVVEQALRIGYRHIDTAEMYENEREVGEGLRASGVHRDEVFITTKVWPDNLAAAQLERAIKASLARLRLAYVDLLLIHWPNPRIPLAETMEALCRAKQAGLTRHIGVSNFTAPMLEEAVRLSTEPLLTNQVRWNPDIAAACKQAGIVVTAHSPLKDLQGTSAKARLQFLVGQGAVVIPRTSRMEHLKENLGSVQ